MTLYITTEPWVLTALLICYVTAIWRPSYQAKPRPPVKRPTKVPFMAFLATSALNYCQKVLVLQNKTISAA